jgi:hypothetical protein
MKSQNLILIAMLLVCLGLSPQTLAVVPAPDGGYPGANTAEGQTALFSLTTGSYNTAVGFLSLRSDATGSFNTAIGAGALLASTADENTATGFGALLSNTTGTRNTANGALALFYNTTGLNNTADGFQALFSNSQGGGDTAIGWQALRSNTSGGSNTAIGENALDGNTTGSYNTACGQDALINNVTGSSNVALGMSAGGNVSTADHVICIGALGANISNSCYIDNIFNATSSGGIAVFVNQNGRLGTMTSSRRFKDNIIPMDQASDGLYALHPVTFRYKKGIDPEGSSAAQFGLVAEDVEKVNRHLVVYDKEGKPYSVRYDQVNAMLLNEFLKEHKIVQELQATVQKQEAIIAQQQKSFQSEFAAQEKRLETVTAGLEKLSAQLELSKSRSQTALNNP